MDIGLDLGLDSLGLGNFFEDLGLSKIFEPIFKPITNIFGSVGNFVKILIGVILFLLIGLPILKWIFRQIFGSKQPQYPYPYPPPGYYPPPMAYPPMGYSTPPMGYSSPPMSYPPASK